MRNHTVPHLTTFHERVENICQACHPLVGDSDSAFGRKVPWFAADTRYVPDTLQVELYWYYIFLKQIKQKLENLPVL